MELLHQKLETPSEFEFPFTPYTIQDDFMKNLYSVIEEKQLGIFESPTGTGKSLSIICGALKWLNDHENREREEINSTIESLKSKKDCLGSTGDDWLSTQSEEIQITRKLQVLQLELQKILKNDEKIAKLRSRKKEIEKKLYKTETKIETNICPIDEQNDENEADVEFLLEDNINLNESDDDEDKEIDEEKYSNTKIYICSRTHSQISQLVHEVDRSPFGANIRLVSLASRQNYCINPNVNKLNNPALINERCLDLQRSSKGKSTATDTNSGRNVKKKRVSGKCPCMQTKTIEQLKESALFKIQDVEQLVQAGKKMNACPYYAARSAVVDAQVVILPYNLILHKSTREASGINLKNNIVIIDEAHNLLEALADMHSAQVTGHQLLHSHSQLTEYKNKYKSRFTPQNLLHINQLLYIMAQLINILGGKPSSLASENIKNKESKLFTLQDFVVTTDIDHLNIYKLLKFCLNSKISQKLNGFASKYESTVHIHEKKPVETGIKAFLNELKKNQPPQEIVTIEKDVTSFEKIPRNSIVVVIAFLESLVNKCEDGRIICVKQTTLGKSTLKFLLLNPSTHFRHLVADARAVIVAGGTMQPMSEFKDRLFVSSGADRQRIVEFSCDHIIPPENILPIALLSGPTGFSLDISYESRNTKNTLDEIGRVLQNVCSIVPGGMVCFFPSYDYEKLVYTHLEQTKVLEKLSLKKQIYREPKLSSDVDKVLTNYSRAIRAAVAPKNGALMFSVVGGKLSEGLNFSDDLGRCVIVIGMPYPNIQSPELKEKMAYLNKNEGPTAGNTYYENICMKAVNQCIGRAVRHRNDYACVLLLDKRYSRPKTQQNLPAWIRRSLVTHEKFGPAFSAISKFFTSKK